VEIPYIEVVEFNNVDDTGDAVLFMKPVETPVFLAVGIDGFAEIFDSNEVVSGLDVVIYLSPVVSIV